MSFLVVLFFTSHLSTAPHYSAFLSSLWLWCHGPSDRLSVCLVPLHHWKMPSSSLLFWCNCIFGYITSLSQWLTNRTCTYFKTVTKCSFFHKPFPVTPKLVFSVSRPCSYTWLTPHFSQIHTQWLFIRKIYFPPQGRSTLCCIPFINDYEVITIISLKIKKNACMYNHN